MTEEHVAPGAVEEFVAAVMDHEVDGATLAALLGPRAVELLGGSPERAAAWLDAFRSESSMSGMHSRRSDTGDEDGVVSNDTTTLFLSSVADGPVDLRIEQGPPSVDHDDAELRVQVDDRALDVAGLSQDELRDPGRALQSFLTFARQPATCDGGTTEGSLIWVEISSDPTDAGPDSGAGASRTVLFSRDVPALDEDGSYVGRWSAGLALQFSGTGADALPATFHLSAEIDDPWATPDPSSDEPTTVDAFEQAFREALPRFFELRADALTVSRLQQVD